MAELIDHVELDERQEADIREDGEIWIHDNGTRQDIGLNAKAARLLLDFLLLHQDRLLRHVRIADAIERNASIELAPNEIEPEQDETGTHPPDCRCSWCEPSETRF